jgi:hypothetical protein
MIRLTIVFLLRNINSRVAARAMLRTIKMIPTMGKAIRPIRVKIADPKAIRISLSLFFMSVLFRLECKDDNDHYDYPDY